MPNFTIVSFTHGGLTALIRSPRGISSAAARTKPSRPALTSEIDALPGIGCIARTPVVRVIEPLSRRASFAARERDLPHQLAAQAEFVVGVGQVGEGLERRIAGAEDHRVDVPDPLEQGADRRRIVESDLHLAVARGADDLMPFERERLYDLAAAGAGRSDDDDFHGFAIRCA